MSSFQIDDCVYIQSEESNGVVIKILRDDEVMIYDTYQECERKVLKLKLTLITNEQDINNIKSIYHEKHASATMTAPIKQAPKPPQITVQAPQKSALPPTDTPNRNNMYEMLIGMGFEQKIATKSLKDWQVWS